MGTNTDYFYSLAVISQHRSVAVIPSSDLFDLLAPISDLLAPIWIGVRVYPIGARRAKKSVLPGSLGIIGASGIGASNDFFSLAPIYRC